jgi:diguanylate cyclase (GGDEF)-like protein
VRDGFNIGTLCSMDTKTRQMTPEQIDIMRDFGQLVIDELELRLLANTDSLTEAMSRRYFYEESKREIARVQRNGTELNCAVIDIDHVKSINDSYGHDVGDLVLQRVVATCKSVLRASDCIGRLGGEEFAAMLPDASRDAALEVVERMRRAVAGMVVEVPTGKIGVTVSIGLATRNDAESNIEPVLQRADAAVYKAKASGRNRTVYQGHGDEVLTAEAAA